MILTRFSGAPSLLVKPAAPGGWLQNVWKKKLSSDWIMWPISSFVREGVLPAAGAAGGV